MNNTDLLIRCMRKTKTESLVNKSNRANPVKVKVKTESLTLDDIITDRLMIDDQDKLLAKEGLKGTEIAELVDMDVDSSEGNEYDSISIIEKDGKKYLKDEDTLQVYKLIERVNEDLEDKNDINIKLNIDDKSEEDSEGDEAVAVIDTDIDSNGEPEPIESYIGKYIVVCPHCLNPLFSDATEGEIYCPVCDEDVEINEVAGKIVSPNESTEVTDEVTDGEGSTEVTDEEVTEESLNESVEVKVCPKGSVTVTSSEADTTVEVAPTDKTEEDKVVVDEVTNEDELDVDDFDTDNFDSEVTDIVDDVYEDENLKYESRKVVRKGNSLIIEGLVKSGKNYKLVRFTCENLKSTKNKFKVEGLKGTSGSLITINSIDGKRMKVESMTPNLVIRDGEKVTVLNRK